MKLKIGDLKIEQMDYDKAKQISKWTYDEPYSIYSMEESENCIDELLSGLYFSAVDEAKNLIGYYCFGKAAQVPAGNQFGVYSDKKFMDIGLGIKPNLCGQGIGLYFLNKGLEYGKNKLNVKEIRLTVAVFNSRAIKVYEKAGFKKVDSFRRISQCGETEFLVMVLC